MTEQKSKAAALVAANKLTVPQIAKEVGVSLRTLFSWKKNSEFQEAVRRAADAWRAGVRGKGVADQDERLRDLNDRHRRLRAVIQQRARDPQMRKVPGGPTGLLCVDYKMQALGEGVSAPVPVYAVDTALLAEMRAIEQHAAIELGQWKLKTVNETTVTVLAAITERLHAGRQRVAEAKAKRDAAARQPGS